MSLCICSLLALLYVTLHSSLLASIFINSLSRNCSSFLPCPGHSILCLPVSVLDAAQGHCVSYYFIIMKFPGMSILFHPVYATQGFPALLLACSLCVYICCLLLRAILSHLVPAQEVSILSYPDLDGVVVFLSAFAPASPSSLLDLLLTFLSVV